MSFREYRREYKRVLDLLRTFVGSDVALQQNSKLETDIGLSGMDFEAALIGFSKEFDLDLAQVDLTNRYYGEGEGVWLLPVVVPLMVFDGIQWLLRTIRGQSTKGLFNNFVKLRTLVLGKRKDITIRELFIWITTGKLDHTVPVKFRFIR